MLLEKKDDHLKQFDNNSMVEQKWDIELVPIWGLLGLFFSWVFNKEDTSIL